MNALKPPFDAVLSTHGFRYRLYDIEDAAGRALVRNIRQKEADNLLALLNSPPSLWIPVSERLPENETQVLARSPQGNLRTAYFADGIWHWHTQLNIHGAATHWMPLPAPPSGEKGG